MADTINVEQLQKQITDKISEMQNVMDERVKALETKGADIEELKKEQKSMAEDLDVKISALEKLTAQMAQAKEVTAEDVSYVEQFNKALGAMNRKLGREVKTVTVEDIKQYNENLYKYITRGEKTMSDEERKSINTMNDTEGGYLVVPQVDPTVLAKKFDRNGLLEVCGKRTTAGLYEEIVDWADYDESYFSKEMPEDATLADGEDFAKIQFSNDVIKYGKKFSRIALEDSMINVEADVVNKMRAGMNRKVGGLIVKGNGGAQPRGLLTYPNGTAFGQIERVDSNEQGKLIFKDVISTLPAKLKDGYHENARYIMRRATFFGLLGEADLEGRLQIADMVNLFSAQGLSLNILGYGVNFDCNMPAVASNALPVAFGDFEEAYLLTSTPTIGIVRNDTHPDYVQLWLRERHDGKVRNFEAVKLLQIKA